MTFKIYFIFLYFSFNQAISIILPIFCINFLLSECVKWYFEISNNYFRIIVFEMESILTVLLNKNLKKKLYFFKFYLLTHRNPFFLPNHNIFEKYSDVK